jgi:putative transcriptional regulator
MNKKKEREKLRNRLREHRARLDISQSDLAEAVGMSRMSIGRIEDGGGCTLHTAMLLGRALETPVDELFYLET